ncbi:hypothetical protein CHL67_06055 [Prosthecochloris sp. GSB1]|uniref:PstS family phosphate ABC transporter substrate-binding protein n=1 Tax=Prosthecochloris sp. GSB1 TaxID=281093 RepID=UPI000B8D073A|nr:substrate-binding domain-containing protein [Prosthecochloris sp. GSB1]ASQ90538.1 hypothetical protein CHL67_06055 [Prosthecochloris sp. GSB1]
MSPRKLFPVVVVASLILPLYLFACHGNRSGPSEISELPASATSGALTFGAESSLVPVIAPVGRMFSAYYPSARLKVSGGSFEELFNGFLRGDPAAMLVEGRLSGVEQSLLENAAFGYRLEPVAKGALVCIANRRGPVESLTSGQLRRLLSGGNASRRIVPVVNEHDVVLQRLLSERVSGGEAIHVRTVSGDAEVVRAVAGDRNVIGFLPLESTGQEVRVSGDSLSIRIVPVSPDGASAAVSPSQDNVYKGTYPLAYIIYYMYRKQDPLAAGFGAWLAREGQKGIVRSVLAPYRQPVRTINLK